MWRYALLGLTLLLPGCADFGDFLGNTFTYDTNPNKPVGDSENMKRVEGVEVPVGPLGPEPGNVWPTGIESAPTLQDLEKATNQGQIAPAPSPNLGPYIPHPQPRPAFPPGAPPGAAPALPGGAAAPAIPALPPPAAPTPGGPQVPSTGGGGGIQTIPPSNGNPGGILVPNGNGTSTLIRPDGTVLTIPTPGK